MNLDLGGTTWLNPSRKLLSFHRYFFTPFDDMPPEVFKEFKHHSHTHTYNAFNTDTKTHTHGVNSASNSCTWCSGIGTHFHNITSQAGDSHNHAVAAGTTGAANLGSPWWNHIHTMANTTGNGGAAHTHARPTNSDVDYCALDYDHSHVTAGDAATASDGAAHTHTFNSNTSTADPTGTPESHTHTFSFSTASGNSHNHGFPTATRWTLNSVDCGSGAVHDHARCTNVTRSTAHTHSLSGTSNSGGEPLPAVPQPVGDGLTFAS